MLLILISWTVLSFLVSFFATFSKASFTLSKAHAETFTWKCILFSSTLHFSKRESPASSFCACNQCHCSISLAPSSLWLAIPAATDPVFLLAFLLQPHLETLLLLLFLVKNIPTFLVRTVLFPSFPKAFHDAPFSPQTHAIATLLSPFLPPETRCNISGINWLCMIPHLPLSPLTPTARS